MKRLLPWLGGNRLLALAILACSVLMVLSAWTWERRAERLLRGEPTERAADAAWRYYDARGMNEHGFEVLLGVLDSPDASPELLRQLVLLADAEERREPDIDVPGGVGLARLAPLSERLGGTTPQEARAWWTRRRYDKAVDGFRAALGNPLWEQDQALRASACFELADALKARGDDAEAAEVLTALAGGWLVVRPPLALPASPHDSACDLQGQAGARWQLMAASELMPPRSLKLDVAVGREAVDLDVALTLDREVARLLLLEPSRTDAWFYEVPGAALGGLRLNHVFIGDLPPTAASMTVDGDEVALTARWRVSHDNLNLWGAGTSRVPIDEVMEVRPLPMEVLLPLWARDVPVEVEVRGVELEVGQAAPMPDEQDAARIRWSWGPGERLEDRPLQLLARTELGRVNSVWVLLPAILPTLPDAVVGLLLMFVVTAALLFHVARRREGPWSEDPVVDRAVDVVSALVLAPLVVVVVVRPLWFSLRGGTPWMVLASDAHLAGSQAAYAALGLSVVLLVAVVQTGSPAQARYLRHLGGLLFAGYLTVYFGYQPWWQVLLVGGVAAPLLYHYWLAPPDAPLRHLTPREARAIHDRRDEVIQAAAVLGDVSMARELLKDWPARIAQGQATAEAFEKAREATAELRDAQKARVGKLLRELGVEDLSARDVVLGVGPSDHPWRNGALALVLGAMPTLLIGLVTGKMQVTLLMIYLLFFGLCFRWLRGSNGLEKGISLALAYDVLMLVPLLSRVRGQVGLTALVIEGLVMIMVMGFAGAMMDVLSAGRLWRRLLALYEAPDLTRLAGAVGAALTAAIAGLAAGSSKDVVSLLWQQVSGQFGGL